ncbi:DUF4126 domain-containing protein [Geoalkalibacter halelectricus]|uniref:DUF4126 domain-containing protein n=1 Tax=Geoalkalibacter halelectricus TaxID=2847045 RepID=A0ABY5ZNR9_9BACT|nr:DUF4126 domain-containing protein [Geoalkalibacter halelectricus]MDO3379974.1 DUF4126 domain-containing protein [Geoalkalibacter halelectricus]UWZ80499.1 DUF4126 domain-containing protein [Geoalkalibacter halelectricus]
MNELHQVVSIIALTMGVAWASGINLYAAILVLGLLGASGHLVLPPGLEILTHPLVLVVAGFMYLVEFFADKVPGVDTSWDVFHTFIRIPAAAALAAAAVGEMHPAVSLAAALIAGGLATGVHLTKAGTRVLINASPEPFSNWTASVSEDVVVVAGLWTALYHPWIFLFLLVIFVALMLWVLPKIWRGVRTLFEALSRLFRGQSPKPPQWPPDKTIPAPRKSLPPES